MCDAAGFTLKLWEGARVGNSAYALLRKGSDSGQSPMRPCCDAVGVRRKEKRSDRDFPLREVAVTDSDWSRSARARLALLRSRSPMRRRIVVLLLEGRSRRAMAVELQRSQHTIDSHLKAMYRAIGVGDRARLMMMVQGLIGPEDLPPLEMGTGDRHRKRESYESEVDPTAYEGIRFEPKLLAVASRS